MTGKGLETQTAANMLRKYAVLAAEIGCHPKQVEHIHFVITQMERDFNEIREQRDTARRLAAKYEEMLHLTPEERDLFTKPVWKSA